MTAIDEIRRVLRARNALRDDCEDEGCRLRMPTSQERSAAAIVDVCLGCGEDLAGHQRGEKAVDRLAFVERRVAPANIVGLIELRSRTTKPSAIEAKLAASQVQARSVLAAAGCSERWTMRGVVVARHYHTTDIKRLKKVLVDGRPIGLKKSDSSLLDALA